MIKGSVTVRPQIFASAVKWAAKFIAAKPSVPIQGGLAIDVNDTGMAITAFGEHVTARAYVPIEGDGAGRVVVSGRLLAELVSTFPDKPVTIVGDEADPQVTITVGRWRGTLPAMDESNWPDLAGAPEPIGAVGGDAFASMIADVAVAASKDLTKRISLACLHLTFGRDTVAGLASDSFRAAGSYVPFVPTEQAAAEGPCEALVLGSAMTEVANAFIGPDDVTVGLSASALSLTSATREVIVRQMGEEFSAGQIRAFFEQAGALPEHALFNAAALLQPMKRAAIIREKDGPISVRFSTDLITLAAAAEDVKRDSDEEVEAQYSGPDHALSFNPKYFAEAIASAPTAGEVALTMTTERVTGVLLTVPGNDAWRHVLMPLRTR